MTKTWKQLEAEGVRRCCVMFASGKRCRRRASAAFEGSWCAKHGPLMKAEIAKHMRIVREEAGLTEEPATKGKRR